MSELGSFFGHCDKHNQDFEFDDGGYPKQLPYCRKCREENDRRLSEMFDNPVVRSHFRDKQ